MYNDERPLRPAYQSRSATVPLSIPPFKPAERADAPVLDDGPDSPEMLFAMSPDMRSGADVHARMAAHRVDRWEPRYSYAQAGPSMLHTSQKRPGAPTPGTFDARSPDAEEQPFLYAFPSFPNRPAPPSHARSHPPFHPGDVSSSPPFGLGARSALARPARGPAPRAPPSKARAPARAAHLQPLTAAFTAAPISPPSSSASSASSASHSADTSRSASAITSTSTSISAASHSAGKRTSAPSPSPPRSSRSGSSKTDSTETVSVAGLSAALARTRVSAAAARQPAPRAPVGLGFHMGVAPQPQAVRPAAGERRTSSKAVFVEHTTLPSSASVRRSELARPKLSREVVVAEPADVHYFGQKVAGTPRTSSLGLERYLAVEGAARGRRREAVN